MNQIQPLRAGVLTALLLVGVAWNVAAQDSMTEVKIEDLQVPNSPAFTLMGISPTSINTPTSPESLAVSLLQSTSNSDSAIPRDIAIEFAPYWWKSRPDRSFSEYYGRGIKEVVASTFSVSFATSEFDTEMGGVSVDGTRMGAGLRFNLHSGRPDEATTKRIDETAVKMGKLQGQINDNVDDRRSLEDTRRILSGWLNGIPDVLVVQNKILSALRRALRQLEQDTPDISIVEASIGEASSDVDKLDALVTQFEADSYQADEDLDGLGPELGAAQNYLDRKRAREIMVDMRRLRNRADIQYGLYEDSGPGLVSARGALGALVAVADAFKVALEDEENDELPSLFGPAGQADELEVKIGELVAMQTANGDEVVAMNALLTDDNDELDSKLRADLSALADELSDLDKQSVWSVEFASAVTYDFFDDDFTEAEFSRAGTWVNVAYNPQKFYKTSGEKDTERPKPVNQLGFLVSARYIYDEIEENDHLFDLGGRMIWEHPTFGVKFSGEYMQRFGDGSDERIVAMLEYPVNDTYSVFASYGKTFENDFIGDDDLVAILGVNIGWGQGPTMGWDNKSSDPKQ